MEALTAAKTKGRALMMMQTAALVSRNVLLLRRIQDSLSDGGIAVLDATADPHSLSHEAGRASVIVLASGHVASERKRLISAALAHLPGIPAVVVSPDSSSGIHRALEAGAAGVVFESRIETTLAATVGAVAVGQTVVPPSVRQRAARPVLSHRERETLALVVMGLTNRQIAGRLFLAESTVKAHLTSIFNKLGVSSRNEAVAVVLDPEHEFGMGVQTLPKAVT